MSDAPRRLARSSRSRRRVAAALFGVALAANAVPAAASEFLLESDVWELLAVPGDASALSVETLFGDDLAIENLFDGTEEDIDATWAAYRFNTAANTYDILRPDDSLAAGEGFWIRQNTGEPVTLDVPLDLPPVPVSGEPCVAATCFVIDLPLVEDDPTRPDRLEVAYGMAGIPAPQSYPMGDILFSGDAAGDCTDGCTLVESGEPSREYTPRGVFVYDTEIRDYVELPADDYAIGPWQGFFWGVSESVGAPSSLHLPLVQEVSVTGAITSTDGSPVEEAVLYLGDTETPLGAAFGNFFIDLPADSELVIRVEATGYATAIVPVRTGPTDTEATLDITLAPHSLATTFAADAPALLADGTGASVALPPNAFEDVDGNPYDGTVVATITPLDVANPAELAAFPGEFAGLAIGGSDETIVSLGTAEYEFRDEAGRELVLVEPAEIEIPIHVEAFPDGTPVTPGQSVALWSLDEASGLWAQESGGAQDSEGVVVASGTSPTGLALRATVTHFSWWNCDVATSTGDVEVTVSGTEPGVASVGGTTAADVGWRPASVTTMLAIGATSRPLPVPAGFEACFSATLTYLSGETAVTDVVCATPAAGETLGIELAAPGASDTLAIGTDPAAIDGVVTVDGRVNRPVAPIELGPLSIERGVDWEVQGGVLPDGVTLRPTGDNRARIVGTPRESGTFNATIVATNTDGESDSITVVHEITAAPIVDGVPELDEPVRVPVRFAPSVEGFADFELIDPGVPLSDYNRGGTASGWSLVRNEIGAIDGFVLDAVSGVLQALPGTDAETAVVNFFFEGGFEIRLGQVTATNGSGSATSSLVLVREGCEEEEVPFCGPFLPPAE